MSPPVNHQLEPVAHLIGTWRGSGEGSYPTIDDFAYTEEVEFGHVGKPFLSYVQRTRDATTGLPLHAESGYLRAGESGELELIIAQPSGITEIHDGRIEDGTITFRSASVAVSASAKSVTDVVRIITVEGDELRYTVDMAAVGQQLQHHLAATLLRA